MDEITEIEITFMKAFSDLDLANYNLLSRVDLPIFDRFLTNEIGIRYIGNMLKNIDIRLYLAYLKMLKDKIKFIDNYDIEKSVCISEISVGVTKNVEVNVPYMRNGIDILVTSHELGHGIKSFTKVNNERHLHSNTMYDETISILFGKLCLERYINDFGYDVYAQQFEILNIKNAVKCLERIKTLLPEYIEKQQEFTNKIPGVVKNKQYDSYKYYSLADEVKLLRNELYTLISYPIGISLANMYDNFSDSQKGEYLEFISKYLLNIKHIDFEMILGYFNIPFDANFYINNFKEYITKFEKQNNKALVLGGRKK
ncbi:MAG: hypothetical protein ACI4WF_01630 [Bacilli bacterium]